jgi:hypothetical protein
MPDFDPNVPSAFLKNLRDSETSPNASEELQDLLNPSIAARQMSPPISGQIRKRLNREYEYFWARDRNGQDPDHSRVEQLRADGWEYATTKDVQMFTEDTVRGRDKEGFSNEIRSGDRRLMKIPMMRWKEMRKAQNLQAIQQTYPQGRGADGTPMGVGNMTPGVRTYLSEESVEQIRSRAVVGDATKGEGNASVARVQK